MTTTPRWDLGPLLEPVTPSRLRSWSAEHRGVRFRGEPSLWTALVAVPIAAVALLFITTTVREVASGAVRSGAWGLVAVVLPAALLLGTVWAVVALVRSSAGRRERLMRLVGFAEANGFAFSPRDPEPSYPGMIFRIGRQRQAIDHIVRAVPRFLDIGNFRYTTGSGKSQQIHVWGFMALRLDRHVPHMLLDARANDVLGMSNLPAAFARDQVLSLEGDFDRHFTLYCPREYERDALYVFTPDLMALLIDEAGAFDVEVIDDWMFVYSSQRFRMGDPSTLLRLLRIVDTVGARTVERTDRYADEHVGNRLADVVAPRGARLRRGVPWLGIAMTAAVIAVWFAMTALR